MRINEHPYTIVGVTAEEFHGTEKFLQMQIFVPISNQASLEGTSWLDQRHGQSVFVVARVKYGVTLPQAKADFIPTRFDVSLAGVQIQVSGS